MLIQRLGLSVLAIGTLLLAACSHTTQFLSEPEGADVYVNNIFVGKTPCPYKSRSGFPDDAIVVLEKEGYEPMKNGMIEKSYRADVSLLLLIPGILPYFFSARYEDSYSFNLKKVGAVETPDK